MWPRACHTEWHCCTHNGTSEPPHGQLERHVSYQVRFYLLPFQNFQKYGSSSEFGTVPFLCILEIAGKRKRFGDSFRDTFHSAFRIPHSLLLPVVKRRLSTSLRITSFTALKTAWVYRRRVILFDRLSLSNLLWYGATLFFHGHSRQFH